MARRGSARHRAGGEQRLVVGVGVEGHERGGHRRPSSRMAGWSPVKVAMLTDCYPPRLGGIESQVRDLSRQLVRAGHEVEVFTATAGPDGERGGRDRPPATTASRCTGSRSRCRAASRSTRSRRRRCAAAWRRRFDVAHAHLGVVSPFATDLVPVALDAGLPVTATFHCVIDRSAGVFRAAGPPRALGRARRRAQRRVVDGGRPRVRGRAGRRRRGRAQRRRRRVVARR